MRRVALKVAYLGNEYHGFQRQPNLLTVEGELIKALEEASIIDDLEKSHFRIGGRTDRGVHALGNVISFISKEKVIPNQINSHLPPSIRIWGMAPVPFGFKPRYAHCRHYRYIMVDHFLKPLNIDKMIEASQIFRGKHNFYNFAKRSEKNPQRRIDKILVSEHDHHVVVDVWGESFLWNMVRRMVRVLLNVGLENMEVEQVERLLHPENPANINPMPPEGLILMNIQYKNIKFEHDLYALTGFMETLKEEYLHHATLASAEEEMMNYLKKFLIRLE